MREAPGRKVLMKGYWKEGVPEAAFCETQMNH